MVATNPTDPALDQPYVEDLHEQPPVSYRLTTRPSAFDPRDYLSGASPKKVLPPAFVLSACYDPLDQSQLGACTANAMAGMYATELLLKGLPATLVSRLALYYAERLKEGSVGTDSGAQPRDGLLKFQKDGVGREELWAYDIARFTEAPPVEEEADGPNHRIKAFYRVPGLLGAKAALVANHPVNMAFLCFSGIQRTRNGTIPLPQSGEQPEGGHNVYLRGYQDRADWPGGGYFILRNSWSKRWGIGGDGLIPYAYAGNSQLAFEFWLMQI